jgi:predicted O-linked N-acetylglucosamine transferase (SPINDLY family)
LATSPPTLPPLQQAHQWIQHGRCAEAAALCRTALASSPRDAALHAMLGSALRGVGDLASAETALLQAVAIEPRLPAAWRTLADVQFCRGDWAHAESSLAALMNLLPADVEAMFARAVVALKSGQTDAAESWFDQAISREPKLIERRFALGQVAKREQDTDTAALHFHACMKARSGWAEPVLMLGACFFDRKKYRAAAELGAKAAALAPDDLRAVELELWSLENLAAHGKRTFTLRATLAAARPGSAELQFQHAMAASRLGLYADGHAALDRALAADPDYLPARWSRFVTPDAHHHVDDAAIARFLARWDEGCAYFEALDFDARALSPEDAERLLLAQANYYLAYTGIDVTERQRRLGRVFDRIAARFMRGVHLPETPRPRGTRLRIGFLTPVLRRHTVMKLFAEVFLRLPRDRFEIFAYALEQGDDAVTADVRARCDGFRPVSPTLLATAQQIADDQCDALVYLDIGMHPRSAALAACRLAPFQALLWGHPVTTGLAAMDAFFSAASMEPAHGDTHYTEPLIPLPGLGCWFDASALAQETLPPRLDDGRVRLVCAQSAQKLLPVQDAVFARILAAAPHAELTLLSGLSDEVRDRLRTRMAPVFAAHGVDFDTRVRLLGLLPEARFREELWQADLALDAFGWSGGVTALETFWGNVPILTLPGEFMRGRHTMAMLEAMDLPQLISLDADDYVAKALQLISQPELREQLRREIGERKSRLYRDDRVIAALGDVLIQRSIQSTGKVT